MEFYNAKVIEDSSDIEYTVEYRDVSDEIFTRLLRVRIDLFKEIIEGKHDDLPESAFLFVGSIDEAIEKAKSLKEEL